MKPDLPVPRIVSPEEAWREVEILVEEIAHLAVNPAIGDDFHRELLDRTVRALGAVGGAVWTRNPQGLLHLEHQVNLGATRLPESRPDQIRHALLLDEAMRRGAAQTVAPHSGSAAPDRGANPTPYWLTLCPVVADESAVALLETFHAADASSEELREHVRLLAEIAALASDHYRARQLRDLRAEREAWERLDRFVTATFGKLGVSSAAAAIAHEARGAIGCDRVSVAVVRDGRWRLEAISGVDWFDRRAAGPRRLEQLAQAALVANIAIRWGWSDADEPPSPPWDAWLQAHVDESSCRTLAVLPLRIDRGESSASPGAREEHAQPPLAVGALLVEHFQARLDDAARRRAERLAPYAAAALGVALEFDRIPFVRAWRRLGASSWAANMRRWPRGIAIVAAVLLAATALMAIPAELTLEAPGELQPEIRQHVFAPSDGVIVELPADHDLPVRAGEPLAVLRDAELDYEFRRVEGEIQTAQARLAAIESLRLNEAATHAAAAASPRRWTAEKEEIAEQLVGLRAQQDILRQRQADLTIRSPIAGRVITWDVRRRLQSRPVARGQTLMTIADLSGPWVVELRVPDRGLGHLVRAQAALGEALAVSYVRETAPTEVHRGTLRQVAATTDAGPTPEAPATVQATVAVEGTPPADARPGAVVQARIHCGRRSLGYVWLHEVVEAVQRWLWW